MSNYNRKLRDASGNIVNSDRLVLLFYRLMRDEIPCGKMENIVTDCIGDCIGSDSITKVRYTNGFLAKYAEFLVEQLRGE